jgi:hypothetical protein
MDIIKPDTKFDKAGWAGGVVLLLGEVPAGQ